MRYRDGVVDLQAHTAHAFYTGSTRVLTLDCSRTPLEISRSNSNRPLFTVSAPA